MPFWLAQAQQGFDLQNTIDQLARTKLSVILELALVLTVCRIAIYYAYRNTPKHRRSGAYAFFRGAGELFDAIIYAAVFIFMLVRPFGVQAFKIPSGSMVRTLEVNDFIVANKLVYRSSDPKVGDIVVFRPPKRACQPEQLDSNGDVNVDFIKRCVGVPGDVVEIKDNQLFRNGKAIQEPFKAFTEPAEMVPNPSKFRDLTADEVRSRPTFDFKLVKYKGEYWPVNIEANGFVNVYGVADDYRVSETDPETMRILRESKAEAVPPGYYLMIGDNRFNSYDGRGWGLVPRDSIIGRSEAIWLPLNRIGLTKSNSGAVLK